MHYVPGCRHMLFFLKDCTHLYICMKKFYGLYIRERFLLKEMENIYEKNYLYFLQNEHCEAVFYCDAYKCIWLSYKCIYNKVHLTLMHSCRHSSIIIITITIIFSSSSHLPSSPAFLPPERVSLSNSSDAHAWRDGMRRSLTQTDAHAWLWALFFFFFVRMRTQEHTDGLPLMTTHTHIIVGR